MSHNPDKYPDPFDFKPERYLDADGRLNDDSRVLSFGFGRRYGSLETQLAVISG